MFYNVDKLIKFYDSFLGKAAVQLIEARLKNTFQDTMNLKILGIGYPVPWIENFSVIARDLFLGTPSEFNDFKWSRNMLNQSFVFDHISLPIPDFYFDKVFICHLIEISSEVEKLISEIWRILDGQGKLILILPNRLGLWSRNENNPFGQGTPFSSFQIVSLLSQNGFKNIKINFSLYFPPVENKIVLNNADKFEFIMSKIFPSMGGIMIVEATKSIYAIPKPKKELNTKYNLNKGLPETI